MNHPHICFVTTGDLQKIAIAKRALGLANHMNDLGWKVSVILQDTEENRYRAKLDCNESIDVYFFKTSNIIKELYHKEVLIRKIQPDFLYNSAFVIRNFVGLSVKYKKIVEHSELQSGIQNLTLFRRLYCLLFEYGSLLYADYIVNASQYLEEVFRKRSSKLRISPPRMLYLPYAFNPPKTRGQYQREKSAPVTFLFLGSFIVAYGIYTILEAAQHLSSQKKTFRIFLLGNGVEYNNVKKFIAIHSLEEHVYAPGFVKEEELDKYFSMADAFISPMNDTVQDWARCPSKLYMYLPYKKPILTCKIGEPYQVLKDEGLYFNPGDSNDLALRMTDVIEGRKTGITIDCSQYTWEENANSLNTFLRANV